MPLEIDVHVQADPRPSTAVMVRGGTAIRVDGTRLNRYVNERDQEWLHDWYPEYVGEHLLLDFRELADCAVALASDELSLFEAHRISLVEATDVFVVERVTPGQIRLAFQKSPDSGREARLPPAEAALGSLASIDEFVAEVLDCLETVHTTAERFGITDDGDYEPVAAVQNELHGAVEE